MFDTGEPYIILISLKVILPCVLGILYIVLYLRFDEEGRTRINLHKPLKIEFFIYITKPAAPLSAFWINSALDHAGLAKSRVVTRDLLNEGNGSGGVSEKSELFL